VKIGPVDTEIALLILKKEEITEGKIYSPVGKFVERAKKNISTKLSAYMARILLCKSCKFSFSWGVSFFIGAP